MAEIFNYGGRFELWVKYWIMGEIFIYGFAGGKKSIAQRSKPFTGARSKAA